MTSQYRMIDGVRYERDLLDHADAAAKTGRQIPRAVVLELWNLAMDGPGITSTEHRTLERILERYNLNVAARALLETKLESIPSRGSNCWGQLSSPMAKSSPRRLLDTAPSPRQRGRKSDVVEKLMGVVEDAAATPTGASSRQGYLEGGSSGTGALSSAKRPRSSEAAEECAVVRKAPRMAQETDDAAGKAQGWIGGWSVLASLGKVVASALGFRTSTSGGSDTDDLSPELRELLADDSHGRPVQSLEDASGARTSSASEPSDLERQQMAATQEIDRILRARKASEILGGGSKEDQHREFKRLALLLHPDKGVVSHSDSQANLAWRLLVASSQKSRR